MGLLAQVRERRLLAYMGAYVITGFVALEGVDQLISYEILPTIAYPIVLVWYLFGILGSLLFAWYHGEKGRQEWTRGEVAMQGLLVVLALATSALVVQRERASSDLALAAAASGLDAKSVAVLYFDDLSPGGDLAYLADGLTESLIDRLSRVRTLSVVSQAGVAPFRATGLSRDSIARILDVGTLVVGTVEQQGDKLRVTTRLVDGFSGADLDYRTSFELPADDIFAAQDTVADRVSRGLRQRIGEEIELRERQRATDVADAWALVQRAARLQADADQAYFEGDFEGSLARFQQADELLVSAATADPEWVEPRTLRAYNTFRRARVTLSAEGPEASDELISVGLEQIEEALALAPNDAQALETRGNLRYLRWLLDLSVDAEEMAQLLGDARADLERAVEIDPTLATAHSSLSHLYYQTNDLVQVVLAARRAYEEDAFLRDADLILSRLFWGHYDLGQFADAQQWCQEGQTRFPEVREFAECDLWLQLAPVVDPDIDAAWAAQARLDSLTPEELRPLYSSIAQMAVGGVIGRAGLADSADAVLVRARPPSEVDPEQETMGYEAAARSVMGDVDGAIALLQRYVAANPQHSFEAGGDLHWWWRNLRDHPEFRAVMATR